MTTDLHHQRPTAHRLLSLDILRLIAILFVICRHLLKVPAASTTLRVLRQGGWIGVDLFFVLSGFLVSGLLFSEYRKHQKVSIGRFYLRRGFKIYPAFYVMFCITLIVQIVTRSHDPEAASKPLLLPALAEMFFFQNYVKGFWGHTWSLAVEEHFYILLPLLLLLLVKLRPGSANPFKPLVWISIALAIVILIGRCVTTHYLPFSLYTHFFPTHLRIDSMMFGVLIGYFYHFHPDLFRKTRRLSIPLIIVGIGLFAPAFILSTEVDPYLHTVGFTQFYIASGMILIGMLHIDFSKWAIARFAAYLGSFSYSIYLWHIPLRTWGYPWLESALGKPYMKVYIHVPIFILSAVLLGVVMSMLIEMPMLKLRDRLFPSKAAAISA